MKPGKFDRRITIQQRVEVQDTQDGTYSSDVHWVPVATVWAEVQDVLPSRAESVANGVSMARRPCRIRTHYRDGVTSDMRLKHGDRTLRIISGPAELGRREGLEMMAEDYSSFGQEP